MKKTLERFRCVVLADIARSRAMFGEEIPESGYHEATTHGIYETKAREAKDFGTLITILRDFAWDVNQVVHALLESAHPGITKEEIGNAPLHYDT